MSNYTTIIRLGQGRVDKAKVSSYQLPVYNDLSIGQFYNENLLEIENC